MQVIFTRLIRIDSIWKVSSTYTRTISSRFVRHLVSESFTLPCLRCCCSLCSLLWHMRLIAQSKAFLWWLSKYFEFKCRCNEFNAELMFLYHSFVYFLPITLAVFHRATTTNLNRAVFSRIEQYLSHFQLFFFFSAEKDIPFSFVFLLFCLN